MNFRLKRLKKQEEPTYLKKWLRLINWYLYTENEIIKRGGEVVSDHEETMNRNKLFPNE